MLRLEKPARDPENTVLKAPASENLCNIRVNIIHLQRLAVLGLSENYEKKEAYMDASIISAKFIQPSI